MLSKVTQDPTRSAQSVYEEVRNSFTQNMEAEEKLLFLSNFPTFRKFQFNSTKSEDNDWLGCSPANVQGDQVLSDGRRVSVWEFLSKTEEVLADGTLIFSVSWSLTHSLTEWADKKIEEKDSVINSLNTIIKKMAKKDASIIHSLEIKLKESKLVISDKNKKMKEMGERDAAIIHSLKKDL